MMAKGEPLTTTDLLAAVSEYLPGGGYQRIEDARRGDWPTESVRLFEDAYGIVAVVVYDTWGDLLSAWVDAQDALVRLMSKHISKSDAKAWDGYLVLLTPGVMASDTRNEATKIRYDTTRVRKLLAAGDDLKSLTDVERVLLPLLPLEPELEFDRQESALDMLPSLLSSKGVPEDAVRVVIEAYSKQQALVERLHAYRTKT
jgi:hypothetical protein